MRKVSNGAYAARRLPMSGGDLGRLRGALLESAVKSFRPSVMLVDKHPLGMRGELRAALERLQAQGGRAVLGLRDILDDPVTVAREWLSERIPQSVARYYDQVLVYGDQRVVDAREEYGMPSAMRAQTRFCGYVADRGGARAGAPPTMRATDEARTRPLVLATAGGGEDGLAVLSTFIRATADAPWDGVVVSGPLSGDAAEMQRLSLESGVGFRRSVPTLGDWFAEVDALVCMGGYNTLSEALCHATPTVCVPRTSPRREQLIRARLLESRGLLRMVAPDELSTVRLGEEIAAVLETTRDQLVERRRRSLEVDGASRAASFLLAQAAAGAGGRTAVPLAA
jgi:predicted glycosyltransferase